MNVSFLCGLFKSILILLPRGCALWAGSHLGVLVYVLLRKRRRLAKANLTRALGNRKSYARIARLARKSFSHTGIRIAEFLRMDTFAGRNLRGWVAVRGEANLKKALGEGNGAILLASWLGSSELTGLIARCLGYSCVQVVSPEMRQAVDRTASQRELRKTFVPLEKEAAIPQLAAYLRENKCVCITLPGDRRRARTQAELLGRPLLVDPLVADLAARTRALIVPTFLLMDDHRGYRLIFESPLSPVQTAPAERDAQANIAASLAWTERYVKQFPEQWPWMCQAWRLPQNGNVRKSLRGAERLLIKMPNWLGDAVMALPAVEYLRRLFPHAWLACLIKENIAEVVRHHKDVDAVIAYEHGSGMLSILRKAKTLRNLRRQFFDLAVLLTNSFESALWMRLADIPLRVGYKTAGRGFLLTHTVPRKSAPSHQIQYYLRLCRALGKQDASGVPKVEISPRDKQWAADFLRSLEIAPEEILIGLCPGAAYGPAKRWLPGRFIELSRKISDEYPARFMLFGGSQDREPCSLIAEEIGEKAIDLCAKTNLREFAALLDRCRIVVSNDSGAMHLAAAIGTRAIGIFGPTDPACTAPPENCVVIKKDVDCSPCHRRECPTEFLCMTSISAAEVFKRVNRILSG